MISAIFKTGGFEKSQSLSPGILLGRHEDRYNTRGARGETWHGEIATGVVFFTIGSIERNTSSLNPSSGYQWYSTKSQSPDNNLLYRKLVL